MYLKTLRLSKAARSQGRVLGGRCFGLVSKLFRGRPGGVWVRPVRPTDTSHKRIEEKSMEKVKISRYADGDGGMYL